MTDFTQLDLEHKRELLTSFRMLNEVTNALVQYTGIDMNVLFEKAFNLRLAADSLTIDEVNNAMLEIEKLFQQKLKLWKNETR